MVDSSFPSRNRETAASLNTIKAPVLATRPIVLLKAMAHPRRLAVVVVVLLAVSAGRGLAQEYENCRMLQADAMTIRWTMTATSIDVQMEGTGMPSTRDGEGAWGWLDYVFRIWPRCCVVLSMLSAQLTSTAIVILARCLPSKRVCGKEAQYCGSKRRNAKSVFRVRVGRFVGGVGNRWLL